MYKIIGVIGYQGHSVLVGDLITVITSSKMYIIQITAFITLCLIPNFARAFYFKSLRPSSELKCFSSRFYGGAELKLGQFTNQEPISSQLSTIIFERAIDSAIEHFEFDKVSQEWFETFLLNNAPHVGKDDSSYVYEQDVLNKLIDSDAILIEHEVTSTEVSMKV